MKIHQVAAGFQKGDAISNEMIAIQSLLRSESIQGGIYSENIGLDPQKISQRISKLNPSKDDILVYHHSIASKALDSILEFPNKKIFIYHNVTPSYFFEPYDLKFSILLKKGRESIAKNLKSFQKFLAVSEFNRQELLSLGIKNVDLFPLHLNLTNSLKQNCNSIKSPKKEIHFLFVGRIAPNKKQDDILRFAYTWKTLFGNDFKIKMIGFCNPSLTLYLEELNYMIHHYSLQENVTILPYATDTELSASYKESDFFLSMSEHEGFCVPLLESMYHEVPVVAFNGGAVKETLGGAGVLFHQKNFSKLAFFINELNSLEKERINIIKKQNQRLEEYNLELQKYSPKQVFSLG